jgi:transposase
MHRLQELVRLHRLKTGSRETARLLGMGPNTERRYREILARAGLLAGPPDVLPSLEELKAAVRGALPEGLPPQQTTSLEAYRAVLTAWLDKGLGPRASFDRLRLEYPAFAGSYSAVKRFARALRRARGIRPQEVAIPVETAPGEIAQVDFGYVGRLFDPEAQALRKAWCFVLVLAFSRHMVVRVVFDQTIETWLRLHVEAFAELGGVVDTVVPDNLKAAVVRAAFAVDDHSELNRSYRELARHYGFKVDPTPPYDAQKKGKVEAGVKYVKGNFFRGREGADVEAVRRDLPRWVREIAGTRAHGTTHTPPLALFEAVERAALLPLPRVPWEPAVWRRATVHRDAHIALEKRLYSVPWKLIGQSVWARLSAHTITVYADDERVATHDRRGVGPRSTREGHLPERRAPLRHRSRAYWEERAQALGEEVGAFVRTIFESDEVLSPLRRVQAIVLHLETVPVARARAACRRAAHFGSYSFAALKTILQRGLEQEPLPDAPTPAPPVPRYARPASQWLSSRIHGGAR